MLTLKKLYQRVESFNTDKAVDVAFSDSTTPLAELNKDQMYLGLTKTGQKISPSYGRHRYARVKHEMNSKPGYGIPDLKLTGAFYQGYKVEYSDGVLTYTSLVEYAKFLTARYDLIHGLGGPFKKTFLVKHLRPNLNKEIKTGIGLKFR